MAADRSTVELERFPAERGDHLLCTAVQLTDAGTAAVLGCALRAR